MDQFVKGLSNNARIILTKGEYYRNKLSSNKSKEEKLVKKACQLGIFPATIERECVRIEEGITCNFFQGVLRINYNKLDNSRSYQTSNYNWIEDSNKKLYTIDKYKDISKETGIKGYRVVIFSHHYIDRFIERNNAYITMLGDYREAIIYDLLSVYSYFPNIEQIKSVNSDEKLADLLNFIKDVSGVEDEEIVRNYINFEDLISVKRTANGYGIFQIKDDIITMITWINESMLDKNQKNYLTLLQKNYE